MANTRKPIAKGLITHARLMDLQPGMVLRMHIPNEDGVHWDWFDVQYESRTDRCLRVHGRLGSDLMMSYGMATVGILPLRSGHYAQAYICIRDEELGLRHFSA